METTSAEVHELNVTSGGDVDELVTRFKRHYHDKGRYDLESQAPFLADLANHYSKKFDKSGDWRDSLKAHGLYNSAKRRQPRKSSSFQSLIFDVQRSFWKDSVTITQEDFFHKIEKLEQRLKSERIETQKLLNKTEPLVKCINDQISLSDPSIRIFVERMREVSETCTCKMTSFIEEIIKLSLSILVKIPPCEFEVVVIGSLARGDATPYSDLEYLFLVKEKSHKTVQKFFKQLAITTYFIIGNLGETKLSHFAIKELEGWFIDQARCGFQIDGICTSSGNIPTGYGSAAKYLIVTPEELLIRYNRIYANPDKTAALRGDLTAMLAFRKCVFHYRPSENLSLLQSFSLSISNIKPACDERHNINEAMLLKDINKFNFKPDIELQKKGYTLNVKQDLFRFPSILLYDLAIYFNIANSCTSLWEAAESMLDQQLVSDQVYSSLIFQLACACYIRLSSYLFYDAHDDRVSVADRLDADSMGCPRTSLYFVPEKLFMALCHYMVPLKDALGSAHSHFAKLISGDRLPQATWVTRMHSLIYSGRPMLAYSFLLSHHGEKLINTIHNFVSSILEGEADPLPILSSVADVLLACGEQKLALQVLESVADDRVIANAMLTKAEVCFLRLDVSGLTLKPFSDDTSCHALQQPVNTFFNFSTKSLTAYKTLMEFMPESKAKVHLEGEFENLAVAFVRIASEIEKGNFDQFEGRFTSGLGECDIYDWLDHVHAEVSTKSLENPLSSGIKSLEDFLTSPLPRRLTFCVGDVFRESGNFTKAAMCYQQIVDSLVHSGGERASIQEAAHIYRRLGGVCFVNKEFGQAKRFILQSQSIYEKMSLNSIYTAPELVETLLIVAHSCWELQEYNLSEKYFLESCGILEVTDIFGAANVHREMAEKFHSLGLLKKATKYCNMSLQTCVQQGIFNNRRVEFSNALCTMGIIHLDSKLYESALRFFDFCAMFMIEKNLDVMSCWQNLSAYPLEKIISRWQSDSISQMNYTSVKCRYSMACIFVCMAGISRGNGSFQQSMNILNKVTTMFDTWDNHQSLRLRLLLETIVTKHKMGQNESAKLDLAVAAEMVLVPKCEKIPISAQHITVLYELGMSAHTERELDSAKQYFQHALDIYQSLYGSEIIVIGKAQLYSGKGRVHMSSNEYIHAVQCFNEALSILGALQKTEGLLAAEVYFDLGVASFKANKDYKTAAHVFKLAADLYHHLTEDSSIASKRVTAHYNLAVCQCNLQNYSAAEQNLLSLFGICSQIYGPPQHDGVWFKKIMQLLGKCYEGQHDHCVSLVHAPSMALKCVYSNSTDHNLRMFIILHNLVKDENDLRGFVRRQSQVFRELLNSPEQEDVVQVFLMAVSDCMLSGKIEMCSTYLKMVAESEATTAKLMDECPAWRLLRTLFSILSTGNLAEQDLDGPSGGDDSSKRNTVDDDRMSQVVALQQEALVCVSTGSIDQGIKLLTSALDSLKLEQQQAECVDFTETHMIIILNMIGYALDLKGAFTTSESYFDKATQRMMASDSLSKVPLLKLLTSYFRGHHLLVQQKLSVDNDRDPDSYALAQKLVSDALASAVEIQYDLFVIEMKIVLADIEFLNGNIDHAEAILKETIGSKSCDQTGSTMLAYHQMQASIKLAEVYLQSEKHSKLTPLLMDIQRNIFNPTGCVNRRWHAAFLLIMAANASRSKNFDAVVMNCNAALSIYNELDSEQHASQDKAQCYLLVFSGYHGVGELENAKDAAMASLAISLKLVGVLPSHSLTEAALVALESMNPLLKMTGEFPLKMKIILADIKVTGTPYLTADDILNLDAKIEDSVISSGIPNEKVIFVNQQLENHCKNFST